MKKSNKLFIILIFVSLIICTIGIILYYSTDFFKSNKTNFYNQLSKINIEKFVDMEKYNNYYTKMQQELYANKGTIDLKTKYDEKIYSNQVSFNINNNLVNDIKKGKITIRQNGENLLITDYFKNNDLNGVKFDGILSQYIAVENKDLQKFISKFGIKENENIPNKIKQIDLSKITNKEKNKEIYDRYFNILMSEVPNDSYKKIPKDNVCIVKNEIKLDGYKMILKNQKYNKVVTRILETAKEDEELYSIINTIDLNLNYMSYEQYKNKINEIIDNINLNKEEDRELVISIYSKEEFAKIAIDISNNEFISSFSIEKNKEELAIKKNKIEIENDIETDITITKEVEKEGEATWNFKYVVMQNNNKIWNISADVKRIGVLTSKNIKYLVEASIISQDMILEINCDENIKFDSNIEEELDFNDVDYSVINEINADQLNILRGNLKEIISKKFNLEKGIPKVIKQLINKAYKIEETDEELINKTLLEKTLINVER